MSVEQVSLGRENLCVGAKPPDLPGEKNGVQRVRGHDADLVNLLTIDVRQDLIERQFVHRGREEWGLRLDEITRVVKLAERDRELLGSSKRRVLTTVEQASPFVRAAQLGDVERKGVVDKALIVIRLPIVCRDRASEAPGS